MMVETRTTKNSPAYTAHGFKCAKVNGRYRLEKSGSTRTVYRAGEFCTTKKSAAYAAHGFKCVKVNRTYRLEKS